MYCKPIDWITLLWGHVLWNITEEVAHQGCGLTLHAISQQSSDVLRKHASVAMPLAFLAMHEKKAGMEINLTL